MPDATHYETPLNHLWAIFWSIVHGPNNTKHVAGVVSRRDDKGPSYDLSVHDRHRAAYQAASHPNPN